MAGGGGTDQTDKGTQRNTSQREATTAMQTEKGRLTRAQGLRDKDTLYPF